MQSATRHTSHLHLPCSLVVHIFMYRSSVSQHETEFYDMIALKLFHILCSLQSVKPDDFRRHRLSSQGRAMRKVPPKKKASPVLKCLPINGQNQPLLSDAKRNQAYFPLTPPLLTDDYFSISRHTHTLDFTLGSLPVKGRQLRVWTRSSRKREIVCENERFKHAQKHKANASKRGRKVGNARGQST